MRIILLVLFPLFANAAFVDYGPPQDTLGHWEFDLYDMAGLQRGTTSNPLYATVPADVLNTGGNITTLDLATVSIPRFAGQVNTTGTPTPASSVTLTLSTSQTVMVIVSGTWTGTLTVEVSSDGGVTYEPRSIHIVGTAVFSSAITANVTGSMNTTAKTHVRLRATSAMTGTATVKFLASDNVSNIYVANAIKIVDGTILTAPPQLTIKAASTAPIVSDTAAVVEERPNLSRVVTGNATTVVKTGPGVVHAILPGVASGGTISVYDGTTAAGTLLTYFYAPTPSGGLLSGTGVPPSVTVALDIAFTTGLTVVTAGSNSNNFTVIYK